MYSELIAISHNVNKSVFLRNAITDKPFAKSIGKITGIRIYISADGIKSVRYHISGVPGYLKENEIIFWENK